MVLVKASFDCILRDLWKKLRDCFGLSEHLKNTDLATKKLANAGFDARLRRIRRHKSLFELAAWDIR